MANITVNRKSGFIRRSGRMRRETLWQRLGSTRTTLAAGTPVLFTGFNATILGLRPFTIIRSRGVLHISSDQIAAPESYLAHLSFAIVSEEAFAIGVTAVPTPETDDSDLFFLFETVAGRLQFGDATGFASEGTFKEYDSRAMRKMEVGQQISIVEENAGAPFGGCLLTTTGRLLLKLH